MSKSWFKLLKKSQQNGPLPQHSTKEAPTSSKRDIGDFPIFFYGVLVVFGFVNLIVDYFNGSFGALMDYILPVMPIIGNLISGLLGILFGGLIAVSYIGLLMAASVIIIEIFKYLKQKIY